MFTKLNYTLKYHQWLPSQGYNRTCFSPLSWPPSNRFLSSAEDSGDSANAATFAGERSRFLKGGCDWSIFGQVVWGALKRMVVELDMIGIYYIGTDLWGTICLGCKTHMFSAMNAWFINQNLTKIRFLVKPTHCWGYWTLMDIVYINSQPLVYYSLATSSKTTKMGFVDNNYIPNNGIYIYIIYRYINIYIYMYIPQALPAGSSDSYCRGYA